MFKKLKLYAVAVCSLLSTQVQAEDIVQDFQTWGLIHANVNLGNVTGNENLKNWRLWLEGQGRFGNDSSQFTQAIIRPGIGYAINDKVTIWAGYAWVPNAKPIANPEGGKNFDENRIWQQIIYADTFSFARFQSRSRFEQRFFDEDIPEPGPNHVAYRFRQLIKFAFPLTFIHENLSFIVQDELFINMATAHKGWITKGFDQNRGFVGLGWKFNKIATGEIGYMNQLINRPHNTRPDQMMHILGVNLFLTF
ncbi:DUF2490 domain-containing protein [Nitrosomonas sp. Is37]|uniref:DUF2490 domain-containing protein n=1 Tax=Nitrosomonas sp. Is37 TaxID=3080535 RepID=UPI00294AA988|nr:DUF2490 domain-containing protein [Nitrosomonas sp. Is37]MDV6343952.1 DUF2490 domain-containing protein [Nitrosomonas sp. Is37]